MTKKIKQIFFLEQRSYARGALDFPMTWYWWWLVYINKLPLITWRLIDLNIVVFKPVHHYHHTFVLLPIILLCNAVRY